MINFAENFCVFLFHLYIPLAVRYHPDREGGKEAIFECLRFLPAIIC